METTRNRIGFRTKGESVEQLPVPINKENDNNSDCLAISPAQTDLLETINSLADIIADKSFSTYTDEKRKTFINRLLISVALNSELNTKTALLLA
jgi:hypothetical protein